MDQCVEGGLLGEEEEKVEEEEEEEEEEEKRRRKGSRRESAHIFFSKPVSPMITHRGSSACSWVKHSNDLLLLLTL